MLTKTICLFIWVVKIMRNILILTTIFFFACSSSLIGQLTNIDFAQQYSRNIKKEYINQIYIPKTVEEACKELEHLSPAESIAKFRSAEEDLVAKRLHFGLGRWIMVKWNFEEGSRYSHLLRQKGITHPDDMIDFTIRSFHKYLNGKDLDIDSRAKDIQTSRKEAFQKKLDKNLIKEETRTVKKE